MVHSVSESIMRADCGVGDWQPLLESRRKSRSGATLAACPPIGRTIGMVSSAARYQILKAAYGAKVNKPPIPVIVNLKLVLGRLQFRSGRRFCNFPSLCGFALYWPHVLLRVFAPRPYAGRAFDAPRWTYLIRELAASGAAAEVVPNCPSGPLGGAAPGQLEFGDDLLDPIRAA
jgi:hypothetical protein